MAMLTGLVIAWAISVPILPSMQRDAAGAGLAAQLSLSGELRFDSLAQARSRLRQSTRWQGWQSR
jgi:hypothetical protein